MRRQVKALPLSVLEPTGCELFFLNLCPALSGVEGRKEEGGARRAGGTNDLQSGGA